MSDTFPLLPAPEPQAEAGAQDGEADGGLRTLPDGDHLIGQMTVAYVCIGCEKFLQRLVVDWVYPAGKTICFGTMPMVYDVARRRDRPHRFDHLLGPNPTGVEQSVLFEEVLCEACYPQRQETCEANTRKLDAWWPSYRRVSALARIAQEDLERNIEPSVQRVVDAITAADLPQILGEAQCTELACKHRTPARRERQLRNFLHQHQRRIERYIFSRLDRKALWDRDGFLQAVVASRHLAKELGLEGDVSFARRLDRPELGAYGTIGFGSQLAQVCNPEALQAWPTMWELLTLNALQRIRQTRSEIKFPYFFGAVEQLRKKVTELAIATFIAPDIIQ
ncbi:MAG: hypothetical protein HKL99_09240 [Burkholderiales bacterium]|nr:hypothetical protein [Burkholderiales bacterium]